MSGYSFNEQLYSLRLDRGLTRKEAAKAIGLTRFQIYLFELGYFRPRGKAKEKLESFFGTTIDYSKGRDCPTKILEEGKGEMPRLARRKRILIHGLIALVMAAMLASGAITLSKATKNDASFYGDSYVSLCRSARDSGKVGIELATNATYHYLESPGNTAGSILFYDSSSFLHFNECNFAANVILLERPDIGSGRLSYRFGGDLFSDSHRCYFNYGNWTYGSVLSCEALYYGQPIEKVENLKVRVQGSAQFDEATMVMLFNLYIEEAVRSFEKIGEAYLGAGMDFLNTFLADREQGRKVALSAQVAGLSLLVVGFIGTCIGISFLVHTLLRQRRFAEAKALPAEARKELPKDIHLPFGIPDAPLLWLSRVLFFASFFILAISFFGSYGLPLPAFLQNGVFLSAARATFMITPFLRLLFLSRYQRDGAKILSEMVTSLLIYVFLAGLETMVAAVNRAWGYDFSELVYGYVPSNVFQTVTLFYLIIFFLFFTPAFIKDKRGCVIWRLLSLIPFGLLCLTAAVSCVQLLSLDYGKNIFLNFWFPTFPFPAAILSVLVLYGSYFLRLFFLHRYGNKAPMYLNSDRFALISNLLAVIALVGLYLFIALLGGNEYAYYLGLAKGEWIMTLVPFFFLYKAPPSECLVAISRADV